MSKFKVGDKAIFVGETGLCFTNGKAYEVVAQRYPGDWVSVAADDVGNPNGWRAEYFEPATIAVGDRVKVTTRYWGDDQFGLEGVVTHNTIGELLPIRVEFTDSAAKYYRLGDLELVWAKRQRLAEAPPAAATPISVAIGSRLRLVENDHMGGYKKGDFVEVTGLGVKFRDSNGNTRFRDISNFAAIPDDELAAIDVATKQAGRPYTGLRTRPNR
jgi:hypothetical protein